MVKVARNVEIQKYADKLYGKRLRELEAEVDKLRQKILKLEMKDKNLVEVKEVKKPKVVKG